MIVFLDPLARQSFIVGAALGAGAGAQLGRWSLLLLWRSSWRAQYLRQLAYPRHGREVTRPYPRVQVEHAGQYVQHDRVRPGAANWSPPASFAVSGHDSIQRNSSRGG